MNNELREKAKAYLGEMNPGYCKDVERDDPQVFYWMASFASSVSADLVEALEYYKGQCDVCLHTQKEHTLQGFETVHCCDGCNGYCNAAQTALAKLRGDK